VAVILLTLIAIPVLAGILAWGAEQLAPVAPRWLAGVAMAVEAALVLWLGTLPADPSGSWISELQLAWIPRFGISFHLAADGLSVLLLLLTAALGLIAVACSWTEIRSRVGFFHFCLLWSLAGAIGVFLAIDLFLFFFFWEVMLVPMYFLIAVWGHEHRNYAAIKFFLFTQGSGLLMLVSIVVLAIAHYFATGQLSFDYGDLLGAELPPEIGLLLMLGFFLAFAVKLPVVPLHTWLADAHTEAPTAGSVILAGVLLKTGAYGLIRFAVPLFPAASLAFAPVGMGLGVLGILYGALLAFGQNDLKRLIAYTSVSHMGFVLLGIYAWNALALNGAVIHMLAHGLSTGALFVLVGALQERTGTRDLGRLGGLWATAPRLAAWGLFLAIASLGLPGLANFVGEFLVLLGVFRQHAAFAAAAALGLVAAAAYALIMVQRAFHGDNLQGWAIADLDRRESAIMIALAAGIVGFGLFPQTLLSTAAAALGSLQRIASLG
jgi:NADH-quinone oxidoreductase subunit M